MTPEQKQQIKEITKRRDVYTEFRHCSDSVWSFGDYTIMSQHNKDISTLLEILKEVQEELEQLTGRYNV